MGRLEIHSGIRSAGLDARLREHDGGSGAAGVEA
jgi:hypothetical protein